MKFNRKGFTLVELMIVVAIIGVLASLAVPNYRRMLSKTKAKGHASTIASLKTAIEGVHIEYLRYPNTLTGTVTGWMGVQPGSTYFVDCNTVADAGSASNTMALRDLCNMMPLLPDFASPAKTHCGVPATAIYMYVGNGVDYKVIAHCVASVGDDRNFYQFSNMPDPIRTADAYGTNSWSMGLWSPGGAAW